VHWFSYTDGILHAEDAALPEIAEQFGTPTYVYSRRTIDRHLETIDGAFSNIDHLTCYSVKANSCGAVLQMVAERGLGADIVSGGELHRALRAGIPAERIVYSGVGKTSEELRYALQSGILMFNVESAGELEALASVARDVERPAPVSFRVNPDVDPKTHPYISTGLKKNKFGVPIEEALELYARATDMEEIDVVGMDAHIGSQLTDVAPFREAAQRLAALIERVRSAGADIRIVDIGGGLGINYEDTDPPDPSDWADMVVPIIKETGCSLIIEPGRSVVGNAGVLLTRVQYVKSNGDKTFVVVDAAMNDLARPSLYDAYHMVLPVVERAEQSQKVDIVGPICESGDFIARDREIVLPREGDLLAVMSAGAYGSSMASNYNSRPRGPEVMIDGGEARLVTRRETYDDLESRDQF
jgi:diaminopimelate decarboxylase